MSPGKRGNSQEMEKAVSWKQLEYALRFGWEYMLWVLGMGWRASQESLGDVYFSDGLVRNARPEQRYQSL